MELTIFRISSVGIDSRECVSSESLDPRYVEWTSEVLATATESGKPVLVYDEPGERAYAGIGWPSLPAATAEEFEVTPEDMEGKSSSFYLLFNGTSAMLGAVVADDGQEAAQDAVALLFSGLLSSADRALVACGYDFTDENNDQRLKHILDEIDQARPAILLLNSWGDGWEQFSVCLGAAMLAGR